MRLAVRSLAGWLAGRELAGRELAGLLLGHLFIIFGLHFHMWFEALIVEHFCYYFYNLNNEKCNFREGVVSFLQVSAYRV